MSDPLKTALAVSTSGIAAQTLRMRIVSENVANANVTAGTAEGDPYQRKTISFATQLDRASGAASVRIDNIQSTSGVFKMVHNPHHVAADENGMVKMPDVDMLLEMADMRETVRSYEANMQAVRQARQLINMAIDMMRG